MTRADRIRQLPSTLVSWWRKLISPPSKETVCQWAAWAIQIKTGSAELGSFSVRRRPQQREPLERHRDPKCRILTLCWGSQQGKTMVIFIGRFFRNRVFGYSCLIVLPSVNFARRMGRTYLLPLLRNSPAMQEIIPPLRHSITSQIQTFTSCFNIITGSNSPTELSGQPVPDWLGDEVDKYFDAERSGNVKDAAKSEANATKLIPQRAKSFSYSLGVWTSTPTKPTGAIWKFLHEGDVRRWNFWCPGCGKPHPLTHGQMRHPEDAKKANGKWDWDRVESESWHECPHDCGYKFRDPDKHRAYSADWEASKAFPDRSWEFATVEDYEAELARRGPEEMRKVYPCFWLPTNPDAKRGHNSYQSPSWNSPDSKCTIGACRVQYLEAVASGEMQAIQDYFNQTAAEAFDVVLFGVSAITDLPKGSYEFGDKWEDAAIHGISLTEVRIAGVDRQQASFWIVVRTLAEDGSTRLFWAGEVATFDEVDTKCKELGAQTVLCDCSYKMKETLDECQDRGWIPMRGEDKQAYPVMERPSKGWPQGRVVNQIYRWATFTAASGRKVTCLCWAKQGGWDQLAAMIANKTGVSWTICQTPPEYYTKQVTAKSYMVVKGRLQWALRDHKAADHCGDCEAEIAVWQVAADLLPGEAKMEAEPAEPA